MRQSTKQMSDCGGRTVSLEQVFRADVSRPVWHVINYASVRPICSGASGACPCLVTDGVVP